jgi:hypothetical protein
MPDGRTNHPASGPAIINWLPLAVRAGLTLRSAALTLKIDAKWRCGDTCAFVKLTVIDALLTHA